MQTVIKPVLGTGTNNTYVYLGFCPDVVEIFNYTGLDIGYWHRLLGNDAAIVATPTETDDSGWVPSAESGSGIKLVQFGEPGINLSSAPSVVTDPNDADGIMITSDFGSITAGDVMWVKAYRATQPVVKATHDGGDNATDLTDTSQDFAELGVCGGQQWLAINLSNAEYCYVGKVQKPFGYSKYCKCTLVDAAGNDLSPDVDDDDVFWLMPKNDAQYPLSDIGIVS